MNVVIVTNTYRPHRSAAARAVEAWAESCRARGHRVLVVAPDFERDPAVEVDTIRLPALPAFRGSDFAASVPLTPAAAERLEAFQPDVVHAFQPFLLGATALRISVAREIPLVFSHPTRYEHGYAPTDSPALRRFVSDLAIGYCNLADAVVVPHAVVAAVLRDRGVTSRLEVIPPGVDVERFRSAAGADFRREQQIPPSAFVVGHVVERSSVRNVTFVARSLADFLHRNSQAHALLLGDEAEQRAICEQLGRLLKADRVHRLPVPLDETLDAAYAAMNVLLSGSTADAPGPVLLEALAAGVPVVALDAPELRELIVDGENGRLIAHASRSRCVAALGELAAMDRAERRRGSERARAAAARRSLAESAARALELYAQLIESKATAKDVERSRWESLRLRMETEWSLWSKRAHAAGTALRDGRHPSRVPVLRHVYTWWRRFRRWTSRREWSVKLLDLPVSQGTADEPGLVLLQIDGLSRNQFERALKKGRLPFLARLLRREGYRTHTLYSGQPTTTPAVLGELFYGVEQAVPAFGFRDHRSGEVVQMFQPGIASTVQQELSEKGEGLLSEGSAYCDIYSGGAAESSFCPATTGWRNIEDVNVWKRMLLFLMNMMSLLRIVSLAAVELFVSLGDCIRGIVRGREFWRELLFVPRRVIVNVVLRELIAIGTEADVTRGVPALHANFLGYDENAHRRGPGALFAHFTLRGIDRAIQRIWNAAHASGRRDYHLWVMSDHGQQHTIPYTHEFGRKIGAAVTECYRSLAGAGNGETFERDNDDDPPQNELQRADWLFGKSAGTEAVLSWLNLSDDRNRPTTVAIGPVGFVYWPDPIEENGYARVARRLIEDAGIPLVMAAVDGAVLAWNAEGEFHMPDDAGQILPADHPHLDRVAEDFTKLCFHDDAGDFLICGWRNDRQPISFVPENGAHGGPGPEETSGFVLVPAEAPLPETGGAALRPGQLRQMGLDVLRRRPLASGKAAGQRSSRTLRLATYNVHSCIGLDGRLSPSRIARVLASLDPDVVALQELDVRRRRSEFVDQARQVAEALNMQLHFHPSFQVEGESYGNALLSRLPLRLIKAGPLSSSDGKQEPRGALWGEIDVNGTPLQVVTTHLGLSPLERLRQVEDLLGPEWLEHPDCTEPLVLCGDFNAGPRSRVYDLITRRLCDVQEALEGHKPRRTWFTRFPLRRIDHVFADSSLRVDRVLIPKTGLARTASDHLPLAVDLEVTAIASSTRHHRDNEADETSAPVTSERTAPA